jgi:hypothetical protein
VDGVNSKPTGIGEPEFTKELVRGQPIKGLESFGEIVGRDEVVEVCAQLAWLS